MTPPALVSAYFGELEASRGRGLSFPAQETSVHELTMSLKEIELTEARAKASWEPPRTRRRRLVQLAQRAQMEAQVANGYPDIGVAGPQGPSSCRDGAPS